MNVLEVTKGLIEQYTDTVQEFEEQLTYGLAAVRLDIATGQPHGCTLYLHEQYPMMLMVIQPEGFLVLNTRQCRTRRLVPQLEIQLRIKSYLEIKDGVDELILLFPSASLRNKFSNGLQNLINKYRSLTPEIDSNIMRIFLEADTSRNGLLSLEEIEILLRQLNISPNEHTRSLIKESKKNMLTGEEQMSIKEFEMFAKLMTCKLEMLSTFETCIEHELDGMSALTHAVMDRQQFGEFLMVHQKTKSFEEVEEITQKVFAGRSDKISFYNFCVHLMSKENSIISGELVQAEFSEDHPLHHYYCLSSHNTYLSGNQLTSTSKVERYIEDLEDGVRCVELDVHDDEDTPIIKHGYTATEPILFEDVIYSIAKFCDQDPNHTPIILSLENHCCRENKQRIAHILVKHFCPNDLVDGKLLMVKGDRYPTLKELRGKIIVKGTGKYKEIHRIANQGIIEGSDSENEQNGFPKEEAVLPRRLPVPFAKRKAAFLGQILEFKNLKKISCQKLTRAAMVINGLRAKPTKQNAPQLLSITSMLSGGKIGNANCWESVSLSEGQALKLFCDRQKLHRQTSGSWVRVYPSGTRINSSNYNPLPMLEVGAQIVALNTQHKGIETNLLYSFFTGHPNQKGYLLKPQHLRHGKIKEQSNHKPMTIKIKVLSCHSLVAQDHSQERPDVQVNIGLFGSQVESKLNVNFQMLFPFTQVVQGNSYNPIFRQAREFVCRVSDPFFAIIYFEVPKCGQAAVPVRLLRKGFRSVTLMDSNAHENGSLILVYVDKS